VTFATFGQTKVGVVNSLPLIFMEKGGNEGGFKA
jgi:hypothetical protein